jgi:hypothetical protein
MGKSVIDEELQDNEFSYNEEERRYLIRADELADAEVQEAEMFAALKFKDPKMSDWAARFAVTAQTGARRSRLAAIAEVYKQRMHQ